MTLAAPLRAADPLEPVLAALGALGARTGRTLTGVGAGLRAEGDGWIPATALLDGSRLDDLLDGPVRLWGAKPHAAAALAYKQYTYWLAMPVVLGWAAARRVPLLPADNVAVRLADEAPYVTIGMRRPLVAVLPDDPAASHPDAVTAGSDAELLDLLADTLLRAHIDPLVEATRQRVRIGAHTLRGQLAAAVGYVLADAPDLVPDPAAACATLLSALDMPELAALRHDTGGAPCVARSTCCLAFVVPGLGGRTCPECCVNRHT